MNPTFVANFWGWCERSVNEEGVFPQPGMVLVRDGKYDVCALAGDPSFNTTFITLKALDPDTVELMYALDRYAKPEQGTEYADLLAGAWFGAGVWRPFVIEYRAEPKHVKPICWTNTFWNKQIRWELKQHGVPMSAVQMGPVN